MLGRDSIEEGIGVAAVLVGALAALSRADGLFSVAIALFVVVEGGLLWRALHNLGGEPRRLGSRLLLLVGIALLTLGSL